jgi:hypothetical protein
MSTENDDRNGDNEYFHDKQHGKELHVQLPGYEDMTLSFVGRPDYGTVTMYVFDMETAEPLMPVFECEKDHFEMLLEQASGALMNANGDYPQSPGLDSSGDSE